MIEYKTLTKADAIAWQAAHPASDRISNLKVERMAALADNEIVALIAVEDEQVVGRVFVKEGKILVPGEAIDRRTSGDLYVKPEYRPQGVGVFLTLHLLELGKPQLTGGLSGTMQQILSKWDRYQLIDSSLIYSVPLTINALLFTSRVTYYRLNKSDPARRRRNLISGLSKNFRAFFRPRAKGTLKVDVVSPDKAVGLLGAILSDDYAMFQIPWNKNTITDGLLGQSDTHYAWVLRTTTDHGESYRLVSVYMRDHPVRVARKRHATLKEAQLNEIFPPIEDETELVWILSKVKQLVRPLGSDVLMIFANSGALDRTCRKLSFQSFRSKTVSIATNDLDGELKELAGDPNNWWCRAINEEQIQETSTA